MSFNSFLFPLLMLFMLKSVILTFDLIILNKDKIYYLSFKNDILYCTFSIESLLNTAKDCIIFNKGALIFKNVTFSEDT